MTRDDDPYATIDRLLSVAKEEALIRGMRDPIWQMIHRAEALLGQSEREEHGIALALADWLTVRFGASAKG